MTFKCHGVAESTCTQRVMLTAAECGIPLEMVSVDWKNGEHKSAEFMQHQPFGAMPYFEDTETGLITFESRAISRYIAIKCQAGNLIPLASDPEYLIKTAKFETAASVEYVVFDPPASSLVFEKLYKGMMGKGEPDPARIQVLTASLTAKMSGYEAILSKQPYLAGDGYTLADLFHIPYGTKLFELGLGHLITDQPSVAAWWRRIADRPATKQALGKPLPRL